MSCTVSERIRHVVIVSLTSDRTQNHAGKGLTRDSLLEDHVSPSELREHWSWKTVREKGILSGEVHLPLEELECTALY